MHQNPYVHTLKKNEFMGVQKNSRPWQWAVAQKRCATAINLGSFMMAKCNMYIYRITSSLFKCLLMTIESITVGSICLAVWAYFYDVWSGAVNERSKSASQPRYNKRVVIHTCTYMYMVHVVMHVSEFHYDTIKDAVLCYVSAMTRGWSIQ